ncbi:putative cytochrome P450 [Lophiotrema nucula]|uniref:Putative cytochrome P450 n=1 Tax=Lophiotrema nucula TaxID=690887 RepID=A0A6A5YES3_9PLEO|nr:putative cytochrome P450 [Lophiotrema nucula]
MFDVYYLTASLLVTWSLYRICSIGRRPKRYPPGPPTLPVLGNLHMMPKEDPHLQFQQWAKEYGPIYSLMLGTKVMVVLNKDHVIKDLVDKKGATYGSRPDLYIGQTLISGGHRLLMMRHGPTYRIQRKLVHIALNVNKAVAYLPYQEMENRQLMYDLMMTPSGLLEHLRRFSSSLITSVVFGFRWKTFDEPRLQEVFSLFDNFMRLNATGGAALADFYPILRSAPAWLSPIQQEAIEHHDVELPFMMKFWLEAKEKILNKAIPIDSCTCGVIVKAQQQERFSDPFAAYISGSLVEAGSDTTSSSLYGFVQAMLVYPDVQRAVQAEIDKVIGYNRYPTMEDMPSLPYVRACVKETHRWMPTAILGGFPHATTEDDHYNGYLIPKDATILLNTWTIHRDPERHPNPELFQPERYFGDDTNSFESANLPDVSQRDHMNFGAGRRFCPGVHVADRSMLLAIARLLWAFNIKPKKDADGNDMLPKQDDFIQRFVVHPNRYECEITPRSEKKAQIIKEEWEKVSQNLDEAGQYIVNPIRG